MNFRDLLYKYFCFQEIHLYQIMSTTVLEAESIKLRCDVSVLLPPLYRAQVE